MGRRKQKLKSGIYIIGEGITEQHYFAHIKKLFGFYCTVKPRFFTNNCIAEMEKRIKGLLQDDIVVICVFDSDVSTHNESERKKLEQLQNKYRKNKNILLCNSLPSIEYWFLLHHENTNRHFRDAKAVENALKKYISDYEKTKRFLKENEKWVTDLCVEGKLDAAIARAERFEEGGDLSYTNVHKAIILLRKDLESRKSNVSE
jgi:hypothetical protein